MRDIKEVLAEREEALRQCNADIVAIRRVIYLCGIEDPEKNLSPENKASGEDVLDQWQDQPKKMAKFP